MSSTPPNLAVVGATGLVGREMISLVDERRVPCGELRLLASARSVGTEIKCGGETHRTLELTPEALDGIDIALFAVESDLAREYVGHARSRGVTVIDNSSAFRMDPEVPLVVPEINGDRLDGLRPGAVIANPNCSTIIALMAVTPLHRAARVDRMVVSTYQAASGGGLAMLRELERQVEDHVAGRPYRQERLDRPYLFNIFSHDSPIGEDGSNTEETKLVRETHRIWDDDTPRITATCVRVPVLRAHCEAINLTFSSPLPEAEARRLLEEAPGVRIVDDRAANRFPEPALAAGCDDVLVGRILRDGSQPEGMGLNLFVCGDQIRKGAGLNAVQIAERLGQSVVSGERTMKV